MVTRIKANGITLAIQDRGPRDGVPLLLIRGQGSQMAHWPAALIDGFADRGFRVIAFDNRDTGLSDRCPSDDAPGDPDEILRRTHAGQQLPAPYLLADMAGDAVAVLDALHIDRAHIFGISMGGAILQTILIDHPDRVLSATIVMTACRPLADRSGDDPKAALALMNSLLVFPQTLQEYQDAQVREHQLWGSPGYPMPEHEIREMAALAYGRGVDAEGRNRQLLAIGHATDRRPALRAVDRPCLVIHGRDDTLIPLALGEEIAAHIPQSEFQAIDGMGHIITPALSPVIVDMVAEFVTRRAG